MVTRCASAIQTVCPLASMAETQPQLQPALLRLSAMISQYRFTGRILPLLFSTRQRQNDIDQRNEARASIHDCRKIAVAPSIGASAHCFPNEGLVALLHIAGIAL